MVFPFGKLTGLGHPQLLRVTKTKEGSLHNHQGLTDNQELSLG